MPPPGGYPPIRLNRGLGKRGPPGWAIWGAIAVSSMYGFYQLSVQNEGKRSDKQEKRDNRMAIGPYLMAERDVMDQKEYDKTLAREAEIMKNRPDWVVGQPIYSKRWMPPTKFEK